MASRDLGDKLSDADMDRGQTSDDEDPKKHANNSRASSINNETVYARRANPSGTTVDPQESESVILKYRDP